MGQSLLIGPLADYFVIESPSPAETRNAYLVALGISLLGLTILVCHGMTFQHSLKMGMLTRVMFTSSVYQKVLMRLLDPMGNFLVLM